MSPPTNLTMKLEVPDSNRSDTEKVKLQFEDGTSLRVLPEVVADLACTQGMELSEEEGKLRFSPRRRASAKARAVRIVSANQYFEAGAGT